MFINTLRFCRTVLAANTRRAEAGSVLGGGNRGCILYPGGIMKDNAATSCRETFADGLETVHMLNGTVRLDLFTLQARRNEEKPVPMVSERIIIPLQGFIQLYETLGKVVDKLVQDGVLNRKPQETNNWDIQK